MAVWQHGTELSIFMTGFGLDSYDCQMTLLEAAIFHCVWRFHGCGDALGSGSRKKILMTSLSMARVGQISSAGWGKSIQCCLLYICRNKTYPKVMKQVDITGSLSIFIHIYLFIYSIHIYIYLSVSIYPTKQLFWAPGGARRQDLGEALRLLQGSPGWSWLPALSTPSGAGRCENDWPSWSLGSIDVCV